MRLAPLLLLLAGCPADDTDIDSDTDTERDTERDTEASGTVLSGVVRDEAGAPLAGVRVNLCRQVCITAETGADGHYEMPGLLAERYALHVETYGDLELTDPSVPFDLIDAPTDRLDVMVPSAVAVPLPSTRDSAELADDLFVSVQAGDLSLLFEDEPTAMAAARVPLADSLPIDVDGEAVAVWYVEPWDATADPAVALTFRDTFGTAADTYTLYQANYNDAEWEVLGTLNSDGSTLSGDVAMQRLDTLVLVRNAQ